MKKKILSIVLCLSMMMGLITMMSFITANAASPEFYAVFNTAADGNKPANTLTFYYDDQKDARKTGTTSTYDNLPTQAEYRDDWEYDKNANNFQYVVIDSSVANYHGLKSTAYMFYGFHYCKSISGCEYLDVSCVTNMKYMFSFFANGTGMEEFTSVPNVSNWDTGKVTSMSGLFQYYGGTSTSIASAPDVSKWNTSNLTDMGYMFANYAKSSTTITAVPDVSKWDTSNVSKMTNMFAFYAKSSTTITAVPDVSKWDTSNVTVLSGLFNSYAYSSLSISSVPDVSEWNTSKVTSMQSTFADYACRSTNTLQPLDLSGWSIGSLVDTKSQFAARNMFKSYNSSAILDSPIVYAGDWSTTVTSGATAKDMFTGSKLRNAATVTSGENQWSFANTGATGCFTFKPVKLIVTNSTVADRKYDGTVAATATVGTVVGKRDADSVTVIVSSAVFEDKNAGTGKKVVITYSLVGPDADNYIVPDDAIVYADIVPKELTVAGMTIQGKVYDGTTDATISGAGMLDGVINGENVSFTATASFNDKNAGTCKDVSVSVVLKGPDAANYTIENLNSYANITQRQLTFTSASDKKEYDGTPLTKNFVTITGDDFVEGEGAIFTVTGSQTAVGSSPNSFISSAAPDTDLKNYEITEIYGTIEVTPCSKPITIVADSASKMYDGTALSESGYTVIGKLGIGDYVTDVVINGSITDAGTACNKVKSLKICNQAAEDVTNCYGYISTLDGDLTITKRNVTLESGSAVKNYDGTALTNNTIFVSGDGFITGEGCQYLMGVPGGITNAGSVINSFDYILNAGTKAQNYNITTCYGDLTVNKADLTVSATKDQDVLLGNNGAEIIWNFEGAAYGEEAALAGAPALDSWTLGSQLVFKGTLTLADNGAFLARNYNMVFENGICVNVYSAEISLADIDFSAYGVYTGSEIKADYIAASYNGKKLVEGTDYEVAYLDNANAGQGTARIIITGKGCYCGQTVRWFTIAPASVSGWTVSEIANQKYTGYTVTPAVTVSEGEKVLVKDVDYKLTFANNVNAGTATAVVSGIGNYDGKIKKVFIIEKAEGEGEQEVVPTIFDLVKLQKLLSGQTVETGNVNLDVNGDGNIDIFDLVRLKKRIANG